MTINIEKQETYLNKKKPVGKSINIKKIIVISLIAIAAVFIISRVIFAKPKVKAVTLQPAAKKTLTQTISVTGNIDANHTEKTALNMTQKVTDIFVNEGQDIKKGTPIVKLDTYDLEYQLNKAVIGLNSTQQNYANGKKSTEDAVTQAGINLQKTQGDYNQIKKKLDANQVLYNSGFISKDEFESSQKAASDSENQLKLIQMQFDTANSNLSDFNKTSQLKVQIDQYNADIDNLNKKIKDSTITAGIDGRVVRMDAVKNEYPKADKNTIAVCDVSSYKLTVDLNQFDAVKANKGQKVSIKVKGIDNKYTGIVSKIGQIADTSISGANKETKLSVEITLDNPDSAIKVGYEADADITLSERKDVLTVNFEAVKQDVNGKYLFVLQDNKVVKRYIKTGTETDFDVEITDGIKEGEQYIAVPPENLKEGELVNISGGNKK